MRILNFRANAMTFTMLIGQVVYLMSGSSRVEKSYTFIENENSKVNRERAEFILPFIKWIIYAMQLARLLLLIVSKWRPSVNKYFYPLNILVLVVKEAAPVDYG